MTLAVQDRTMDPPDYDAILDDLYIGNLSTALTLRDHPELGITHVLSVCPEYPEDVKGDSSRPASAKNPRHRCIPVQDSEYEDILSHLPSAVAFIRDALEPSQARSGHASSSSNVAKKGGAFHLSRNRVLVHCVMGISRSTTIVCAYLMATRGWSPAVALMYIRKRRPQAHPNFGFRRQLAVYAECRYFEDLKAPVKSHPAYLAWLRRRKRDASRYLSRVDNIIEIKIGDESVALSMTEDFPTDPTEAASLMSEIEATHLLTITPASMPPLPPSHPPVVQSPVMKPYRRPPIAPCPPLARRLSSASSSGSEPTSALSSAPSSRSSSFSHGSASTPATSVASLQSLMAPSKLGLEVIYDSDDDAEEPTFLQLADVKHYHISAQKSSPVDLFLRLNEAASFIHHALDGDDESDSDDSMGSESDSDGLGHTSRGFARRQRKRHVLINCKTESRACLVVCAYLMSVRRMSPSQAYGLLEKALPLFNVTRTFVSQLELFRACDYHPSPDHPLVQSWVSTGSPAALLSAAAAASGDLGSGMPRLKKTNHWRSESDAEGEDERDLRRKIGTPARCGSFSSHGSSMAKVPASALSRLPQFAGPGGARSGSGNDDDDIDALLNRCAGVGNPDFAFDVEAFRSALRGISSENDTVADPGAGRKRKGGAG